MPSDALLSPAVIEKKPVDQYVKDLVVYLKKVHGFVQEEHARVRQAEQEYQIRHHGYHTSFQVGDYVLMKSTAIIPRGTSERFANSIEGRLYQVQSRPPGDPLTTKTVTLMDPATGSTDLGFAQPVHIDRLVPVDILPLLTPHDTRTRVKVGDRLGNIEATCVDGRVHVRYDGEGHTTVEDLSRSPHHFVLQDEEVGRDMRLVSD